MSVLWGKAVSHSTHKNRIDDHAYTHQLLSSNRSASCEKI
ncbi:hypothetical protein GCM10022378_15410 [Salinicoccus jeotgali]|uniref:Uncharacterized protein n=1 Tax=Salinicoccus jeotgali TaxID=381634 RepID=A0ABP7F2Y2_9STAP